MRFQKIILLFIPVLLFGCDSNLSYKGLQPIYPEATPPKSGSAFTKKLLVFQVDSLSPTFKWIGLSEEGVAYDFAIWDAIKKPSKKPKGNIWTGYDSSGQNPESSRLSYSRGMEIYKRVGLKETSHKPDVKLLPLKKYYWSVKRSSDTQWSTFDWSYSVISGAKAWQRNAFFLFETPFEDK